MRYLTKTLDFDSRGDSVVTLGKFDGLHRGHMLLIRRVLAIGRTERLETVVFTFDVPPQSKVQHVKPHQLLTNEERRARLEQLGMDCLVECPFVDEVMHMTPEAFIKEILVDKLHAKKVVVGKDFGFGYKRSGTAEMLKEMGPSLGFETETAGFFRHPIRPVLHGLSSRDFFHRSAVKTNDTFSKFMPWIPKSVIFRFCFPLNR